MHYVDQLWPLIALPWFVSGYFLWLRSIHEVIQRGQHRTKGFIRKERIANGLAALLILVLALVLGPFGFYLPKDPEDADVHAS